MSDAFLDGEISGAELDLWIRRSFVRAVDASEAPDLAVLSFFVETLEIPSLADGKRRRDGYLVESGKIKFIPSKV